MNYKLLKGIDSNKDQTYFLYTLTQKELKYSLFPLGDYTKPEVRKLAKKFNLSNHGKKDSQGVCFIGQLDFKDFLKYYIKPKPGDVRILGTSKTIGQHDGVYYYTIGQRHGLNLSIAGGPYFVAKKDIKKNIIYVVAEKDKKMLGSRTLKLRNVSWVGEIPKSSTHSISVKIRYRTSAIPATLKNINRNKLKIVFKKPAISVTPGQAAVIYRGSQVLGGGTIM